MPEYPAGVTGKHASSGGYGEVVTRIQPTLSDKQRWTWQPTAVADRLQHNLFFIPGLSVVLGVLVAIGLVWSGWGSGVFTSSFVTTVDSSRSLLSAVATGTITAVSLVLSMMLVAVSLTMGQFSPRTTQNLLGDRLHQTTIGVMLGTVAYSLVALQSLDSSVEAAELPDVLVVVSITGAICSLLLLVASSHRLASRLRISNVVEDLTERTCAIIRLDWGSDADEGAAPLDTSSTGGPVEKVPDDRASRAANDDSVVGATASPPSSSTGWIRSPEGEDEDGWSTVEADRGGWIQAIDEAALARSAPEGSAVHIECAVGRFVLPGAGLVRVSDPDLDEDVARSLRHSVVVGPNRTMQHDAAFGVVQLEDIGLRALSPGINDANTAREILLNLGEVILELHRHPEPASDLVVDGRELRRASVPTHRDLVDAAFEQMRVAARGQATVLQTMVDVVANVRAEVERQELPGPPEGLDDLLVRLRADVDRIGEHSSRL